MILCHSELNLPSPTASYLSTNASSEYLTQDNQPLTLNFFINKTESNIVYHWPILNLTIEENLVDENIQMFKDLSNNIISNRAQNCLNKNKKFTKTGCSSCGKSLGYKSAHNCKNKGGKGYSCLESCLCVQEHVDLQHCTSMVCKESCGGVGAFPGSEGGLCWSKKCDKKTTHDEL